MRTNLGNKLETILRRIDSGEVRLTLINPGCPEEQEQEGGIPYCGLPTYKAAGWTFCVFDDCCSWDYIEWVESPEGERVEFSCEGTPWEKLSHEQRILQSYSPYCNKQWSYPNCWGCNHKRGHEHRSSNWEYIRDIE